MGTARDAQRVRQGVRDVGRGWARSRWPRPLEFEHGGFKARRHGKVSGWSNWPPGSARSMFSCSKARLAGNGRDGRVHDVGEF